jgi:tRNA(Ile)-lysidine synthetase-like protein
MHNFTLDSEFKPYLDQPIAVAVSGGSDSLALVFYLWDCVKRNPSRLKAFIVNHNLRPESLEEAKKVSKWLEAKGIPVEILHWEHGPIVSNIQENARQARYGLLTEACKQQEYPSLWVGHHLQDQYETVLMRLSKGSGLQGLTGIHKISLMDDITICRPFLTLLADELKFFLNGHPYVQDPSNQNEQYERIRWRKKSQVLYDLGLSIKSIKDTVFKLQKENEALNWAVEDWFVKNATWVEDLNYYFVPYSFLKMPESIVKRVMLKMASRVTRVEKTMISVRKHMNFSYERLLSHRPFTFAGCYWKIWRKGLVCVREWDNYPNVIGKGCPLPPQVKELKKNHPVEALYSLPKSL